VDKTEFIDKASEQYDARVALENAVVAMREALSIAENAELRVFVRIGISEIRLPPALPIRIEDGQKVTL